MPDQLTPENVRDYLSVSDIARITGMSWQGVKNIILSHEIPHLTLRSRRRYSLSAFLEVLAR